MDRLRAIQAFHMGTNGWNDIGYAWAVCPHGDVFQAREDDDDTTDVQGAHDGFNRGSTGITLFGYFHPPVNHHPTEAQLSALVDLVAWIARLREIDPLGRSSYEAFGAPVDNVYGHREVKETSCVVDSASASSFFHPPSSHVQPLATGFIPTARRPCPRNACSSTQLASVLPMPVSVPVT